MTSIEYCHVYIDKGVDETVTDSFDVLSSVIKDLDEYQLVVMVDDYSPQIVDNFDYKGFLTLLGRNNSVPSLMIKESALVSINREIVNKIKDTKEGKELTKYIEDCSKYPCSLFIASWYAYRLGVMTGDIDTVLDTGFKPADKLINILPRHFEPFEKKAQKILARIGVDLEQIENVYYTSDWNQFNAHRYAKEHYETPKLQDISILYSLSNHFKGASGKHVEVGAGSNLYPILSALTHFDEIVATDIADPNLDYLMNQRINIDLMWKPWEDLLGIFGGGCSFSKAISNRLVVEDVSIYNLPENEYDSVSMHFVAESITSDPSRFCEAMKSVQSCLKSGGLITASFMVDSEGYQVGDQFYPAVPIDIAEVREQWDEMRFDHYYFESPIPIREGMKKILHITGRKK